MNIKHIILAMLFMAGVSVQAQSQVSITGEIVGMEDSCKVSLVDAEGYNPQKLLSTAFKGSSFSLNVEVKVPRMVTLVVSSLNPKTGKWTKNASIRTMVDGSPVVVKMDKESILKERKNIATEALINQAESGITMTSGKTMQQYAEYLDYIRPLEWAEQTLDYAEAEAWFANDGDDNAISYMKLAKEKAEADLSARQHEFILLHPDYPVSAALVAAKAYKPFSFSVSDFEKEYAAIRNNADTAHVNFISRNINYFRSHATGAEYTDFTAQDKKGKDVKLSSLRQSGKMTLIDFWASWCGPCRSAIPKVKAMAEKYADYLQVVSCSVDEKKAAWLKAEKEEAMPWPQLLLPMSAIQDKDGAGAAYDITSIPRLVVIGTDGKVLIVTNDPEGAERTIVEQLDKIYNVEYK